MPCMKPMVMHKSAAKKQIDAIQCPDDRNFYVLPCGKCITCRLDHARAWAMRCYHEAQFHDENCFITLTYNNENLPLCNSVCKYHFQKFIKRLRQHLVRKFSSERRIKYYGCGEYGESLGRPHYHVLIFGYAPSDMEILHATKRKRWKCFVRNSPNFDLYTSKEVEKLWGKGFITVGECSFESAGYIARYVTKKFTGEKSDTHYNGRSPEWSLMSTRGAIGKKWIEKYPTDVYPKDYCTINGNKFRPPRYYDKQIIKSHPELFESVAKSRKERSEKHYINSTEAVRRGLVKKLKVKRQLIRSLENDD